LKLARELDQAFSAACVRALGGPSDRPIVDRIASLVTSCKVDEKIFAELRAAAGLDRGPSIVEWAKNTRAEVELLRCHAGVLRGDVDRLKADTLTEPDRSDEELFLAYFPSILGWLAIYDPNRTRDDMLRIASDCCAEMVKLHRERFSSAPAPEIDPLDALHPRLRT
jgi:hypothetical protein